MLEDFQAHPDDAWKDNVCRDSIGGGQSQKPWQPAICELEDNKDNKPDAKQAQSEDGQTLQKTLQKSH
jgi:hypothetical protein